MIPFSKGNSTQSSGTTRTVPMAPLHAQNKVGYINIILFKKLGDLDEFTIWNLLLADYFS
jgi:hypothetical protein